MARAESHPLLRVTNFGPGVLLLLALLAVGLCVAAYRFMVGLEATTNLDQQHPWGLWIAIDVATGVALAAGGFTTAALVHIFHREHYEVIARPALLTAMLGYTFVALGLLCDLGRYYNIWHPLIPTMWQGNSVLFEVGICVVCYLTVLYLEFLPIVCERFVADSRRPRLARFCQGCLRSFERVMFLLVIAGVVLSCLHQSSLGTLMVIAPSKMHPLGNTPMQPLLVLLAAIAVGFPMVIVESVYASWSLKHELHLTVLADLARYVPVILGLYLGVKLVDSVIRGSLVHLGDGTLAGTMFAIEVIGGIVVPLVMFLSMRVRRSPGLLLVAALLVVFGVAINRINVFLVAYHPPYAVRHYFPSIGEILVTVGLVSGLILCYRVIVTYLPVLERHSEVKPA